MAYTFEQSYYFRPYRGNSSFWLNRYGNGSIASHQKATLYTAAGSAAPKPKAAAPFQGRSRPPAWACRPAPPPGRYTARRRTPSPVRQFQKR